MNRNNLCPSLREVIKKFGVGTEKAMHRVGVVLSVLVQPCLPEAKSQVSRGFEALTAGLRKRRRGSSPKNAGESCQACSMHPVGRSGHLPWLKTRVSCPAQTSQLLLVSFVEIRENINALGLVTLLLCASGLAHL